MHIFGKNMLNNNVKDDNFQLFSGFVIKLTHFRAILMPNRNTSDNADSPLQKILLDDELI